MIQLFLPFPDVSHSFQKLAPLLNVTQRSLYLSIQPSIFPCVKLKTVVNDLCPSAFLTFHEPPMRVWGRGNLPSKVSNMATSQKAFVIVTQWDAGIHFRHVLPISSSRPLASPKNLKEPDCPLLSQLHPSSRVAITIFHKKERGNFPSFCPVSRPKVLFIALHCVISPSIHMALFDEKLFIFTNMQSRIVSWPVFDQLPVYSIDFLWSFRWATL